MQKAQKLWPWLALSIIVLWPLLIINKGFDLSDTGFYLTSYRYAFSHPEFHSFTTIASTWLGGLIYHLVPFGQMLAIKIAALAMYGAIAYWSFVILREQFPDWLVLISLALASIYSTFYFFSANYNTFSCFFLSAAVFLLYRGLQRDRPNYLWAAALLLGLNVFTRLPNILEWALAAVPFWYYWFCLGQRRKALKLTFCFALFLGLGCLLFLGLYALIIGPDNILNQFDGLMGLAKGETQGSNHSALAIWDRYLFDDLLLGKQILAKYGLWVIGGSLALLLIALAGRRSRIISVTAAAGSLILGLAAGFSSYTGDHSISFSSYYGLTRFYALAGPLIGLAGLLYYHQRNPLLSAMSGMAIVIFLAMSVGSDLGVAHYLYYVHFTVTVCFGLVYKLWLEGAEWAQNHLPGYNSRSEVPLKILVGLNLPLWFLLGLGLQQSTDSNLRRAFKDAPYYQTNTPVEGAPVLAGMRTNPLRAERLSRLSRELAPFQDMKIVVLGQCPLCLTLTDSEPAINVLWLDLRVLEGLEFERLLYEGFNKDGPPLVLIALADRDRWRLDWRDYHKDRLLNIFMEKHNYVLHFNGDLFQIYLPPDRVPDRS